MDFHVCYWFFCKTLDLVNSILVLTSFKKKKRVFWFLRIGFYNVFGWQEIRAREVLKRERGRRCPISPVWETGEIGKRDQFGVGPTLYLFSTKLRRKTRNCVFHCFLFFALALRKWKPIWRSGYYRFLFFFILIIYVEVENGNG